MEIPSGMIEMEIDNMIKDIEQRLSYQGLKLEQYLQMMGKTMEDIRKEYEPQAIEAIKSRLMNQTSKLPQLDLEFFWKRYFKL